MMLRECILRHLSMLCEYNNIITSENETNTVLGSAVATKYTTTGSASTAPSAPGPKSPTRPNAANTPSQRNCASNATTTTSPTTSAGTTPSPSPGLTAPSRSSTSGTTTTSSTALARMSTNSCSAMFLEELVVLLTSTIFYSNTTSPHQSQHIQPMLLKQWKTMALV